MPKAKDIRVNISVNVSLWSALKIRIAGIANYIANKKYEKVMDEIDKNVAEIREIARKSEQAAKKHNYIKLYYNFDSTDTTDVIVIVPEDGVYDWGCLI